MAESENSNEDTHMAPFTRCRNWPSGCTEIARMDYMTIHEESCSFSQVRCLFHTCGFVDSLNQLPSHLAMRHTVSVMEVNQGTADVVLEDPTSKDHITRILLLLHEDHVFGVVFQRTGQFHTEATLNVLSLTPNSDPYNFEIILRGPAGKNSWCSSVFAPDAGQDTAIGFTEPFLNRMALEGCLRMEIKLSKSVI
ncbi:uncharacterized protein LOC142575824 isoform X2 [Dermacentor variabilis]|uniref:uncharacterized protein LOC142575824 isoform X2 n=1 Tax=Dermacentor variabilis TaxID=34621 RepID=UPI003F5AF307